MVQVQVGGGGIGVYPQGVVGFAGLGADHGVIFPLLRGFRPDEFAALLGFIGDPLFASGPRNYFEVGVGTEVAESGADFAAAVDAEFVVIHRIAAGADVPIDCIAYGKSDRRFWRVVRNLGQSSGFGARNPE